MARGLLVYKHLLCIRVIEESLGKDINCLYAKIRNTEDKDIFLINDFKNMRRFSKEEYKTRFLLSFKNKYFI